MPVVRTPLRPHNVPLRPHETPRFVIIEDLEHTARCVAAIRRRRMDQVVITPVRKETAQ